MHQLKTLMGIYDSLSMQLAYYISKKNPSQIAKFERDQRETALKLIAALATYHGVTEDEFESVMRQDV